MSVGFHCVAATTPGLCAGEHANRLLRRKLGRMTHARIEELLAQMAELEGELQTALQAREHQVLFTIRGKRVEFEATVKQAHKRLRTRWLRWLVHDRPQNLITGPLIYGMAAPLVLLDACVSFYQWACFPIYGIAKVRRSDYLVFDRRHLAYLNLIEKFHCTYCEYGTA